MPRYDCTSAACVMRIKNEARWIAASLKATLKVVSICVILDDHSTDETEHECAGLCTHRIPLEWWQRENLRGQTGWAGTVEKSLLVYCKSNFSGVDEARDKDYLLTLLDACQAVHVEWLLALDGDEILSRKAVSALQSRPDIPPIVTFPFFYLWDYPDVRRIDGIYGDSPDGYPKLRFPRLAHLPSYGQPLNSLRYQRTQRGPHFHCGSLPRPYPEAPEFAPYPVLHYGYIDEEMRQAKYEFYTHLDPNNKAEGDYKHIIGKPNIHAPGPLEFRTLEDGDGE